METNSRRMFFKKMFGLTGLALLAPTLLGRNVLAEEKRKAKAGGAAAPAAGGSMPLAEPGKDIAGSLGYVHKSTQKDKTCANCNFYSADGKDGGEDVGKCQIIPGKHVKAAGYCNTWTKKM